VDVSFRCALSCRVGEFEVEVRCRDLPLVGIKKTEGYNLVVRVQSKRD
jgi:hypothetical protein